VWGGGDRGTSPRTFNHRVVFIRVHKQTDPINLESRRQNPTAKMKLVKFLMKLSHETVGLLSPCDRARCVQVAGSILYGQCFAKLRAKSCVDEDLVRSVRGVEGSGWCSHAAYAWIPVV
jgi:hypothetical protein